jgi:hypothetical protein
MKGKTAPECKLCVGHGATSALPRRRQFCECRLLAPSTHWRRTPQCGALRKQCEKQVASVRFMQLNALCRWSCAAAWGQLARSDAAGPCLFTAPRAHFPNPPNFGSGSSRDSWRPADRPYSRAPERGARRGAANWAELTLTTRHSTALRRRKLCPHSVCRAGQRRRAQRSQTSPQAVPTWSAERLLFTTKQAERSVLVISGYGQPEALAAAECPLARRTPD